MSFNNPPTKNIQDSNGLLIPTDKAVAKMRMAKGKCLVKRLYIKIDLFDSKRGGLTIVFE